MSRLANEHRAKTGGLAGVNADEKAICTVDEVVTGAATFCRQHPEIIRVELFGSLARGEATAASDVDLVVTFAPAWKKGIDGFAYFGHLDDLEHGLAAALGRPAHVIDRAGVESSVRIGNTALAKAIARDGQLVYEADHPTEGCTGPYRGELPQSDGTRR